METILIIILAVMAMVLGIINLKQLAEIEDLQDENRQQKLENESLMENIRKLCSCGDKTVKQ
jgi:cell division protein FtsB